MSLPAATFLKTQQTAVYVVPPDSSADVVAVMAANQSTVTVDIRLWVDLGNGTNRPISPQPLQLDGGDKGRLADRLLLRAGQTISGIATAADAIHVVVMGVENGN